MGRKVEISTGYSASSLVWKTKKVPWDELVKKLSIPVRTKETLAEYRKLPKGERSAIKDVGGYVGGYLRGGKRGKGRIVHRQLVTLDVDFGTLTFADDFRERFKCEAVIHATHSHSEETPKYRLIIPINRTVSVDEYSAIARYVAGEIDIELFDNTGFQSYRLMFWASVSSDVEYYYRHFEGAWLDADHILAQYSDWRDSSLWAISERHKKALEDGASKQEDPLSKKGVIGAFCRTYNIHEAISEYLSNVYESCDNDRYTYVDGSTSAGVVTYDDVFAHSHHGTDPISGMTCNAFDLVRIHKFGHLDPTDSTVNPTKLKSFQLMQELALSSKAVKAELNGNRISAALADFGIQAEPIEMDDEEVGVSLAKLNTFTELEYEEVDSDFDLDDSDFDLDDSDFDLGGSDSDFSLNLLHIPTRHKRTIKKVRRKVRPIDVDWKSKLEVSSKGVIKSSSKNIANILRNDPNLSGAFTFSTFDKNRYVTKDLPWRRLGSDKMFKNVDASGVRAYLETVYGITGIQKIEDGLTLMFENNSFDPVRDYLDELVWDGKKRIDGLLHKYFGCGQSEYSAAAMRKCLVGGVGRTYEPACKFDLMLVLSGRKQGTGKSTFIDRLGGEFYSDSFSTVQGKEAYESIQSTWIVEVAELSAMRKSEVESTKHFVSKRYDSYRPAYGKTVEKHPRRCIFIGTTNKFEFLKDDTGNRRFLPIRVNHESRLLDPKEHFKGYEVDQVWAEAVQLYKDGEPLYMEGEFKTLAEAVQSDHNTVDERLGIIQEFLDRKIPENYDSMDAEARRFWYVSGEEGDKRRESICTALVWVECLGLDASNMDRYKTREVNAILKSLKGWEFTNSTMRFSIYGIQKYYTRIEDGKN